MIMAPKNKCGVCGRGTKRDCPAIGKVICSACCGSKRGTELDCPADCVNFPFGAKAYDAWLRIDGAWQPKALDYILRHVGKDRFEKTVHDSTPSWAKGVQEGFYEGAHVALLRYLVLPLEDATQSLGERWAAEHWIGLNNDERVMALHRLRSLPAILEVQDVLDDTRVECSDLLDPDRGRFIVFDRSTAVRANRFDTAVVWVAHYPHFSRVDGSGVSLDRSFIEPFLKDMRRRAKVALKDASALAVKKYLAGHFGDAFELVAQLGREMQERMLSSLDANHCRAYYRIKSSPANIVAILEDKPDIEPDTDREVEADDPSGSRHFRWMRRGEAKAFERNMPLSFRHDTPEDGVGSLGAIRLSSNELMLETFSRQKFDFAKRLLKKYLGRDLALLKEEIVNLAQQAMERSREPNREPRKPRESTVPPEVEREIVENFHRRHYEKFLDDAIPMLSGLTPRQAAADPKMRPSLIDLMKLHLQGVEKQSRERGFDFNIDWVLLELGLQELMQTSRGRQADRIS